MEKVAKRALLQPMHTYGLYLIFEPDFLKKRPIEFDETFFVGKVLFSSFWNGMACLWSLKLIIGTHFSSISTAVSSKYMQGVNKLIFHAWKNAKSGGAK